MQNESFPLPHWLQLLSHAATAILAVGGTLLANWLGRKKSAAEVDKIAAETRSIQVTTDIAISDQVLETARVVAQLVVDAEKLRDERDAWEGEYNREFTERRRLAKENGMLKEEVGLYEEQVKKMRATLELRSTNYDNTQDIPLNPPE